MSKTDIEREAQQELGKLQQELASNQQAIARLEGELARARSEKELLHRIATAVSLESLLEEMMSFFRNHWGFNGFAIQFIDLETASLTFYRIYGVPVRVGDESDLIDMSIPITTSDVLSVRAAIEQRPFLINQHYIEKSGDLSAVDKKLSQAFRYSESLMIPVVENGESFAVIHLMAIDKTLALDNERINEIQDFISHVSAHVYREKRKNDMEKYKDEQQSIIDLIKKINSSIELPRLLEILGNEIDRCEEFDGYLINLVDETGENLVCEKIHLPHEFHGIQGTYHKVKFPVIEADVNIDAFRQNRCFIFDSESIKAYPGNVMNRFERWKMSELCIVPLVREGDEPIGTLMLFCQFGKINAETIESLNRRVALFYEQITNALFYSRLKSQAEEIETATAKYTRLMTIINSISNLTSIDQIYETILKEFLYFFQFDLGTIFINEGSELVMHHNLYMEESYRDVGEKFGQWAEQNPYPLDYSAGSLSLSYMNNVHLYYPDIPEIMHLPMASRDLEGLKILQEPKSLLIMPIRQGNTPIGVVWLFGLKQYRHYSEEQIKLIELLSTFVGTAIANADLYSRVEEQNKEIESLNIDLEYQNRQLADLARRDRLTGLYNFGFFQEELIRRINEYQRAHGLNFLSLVLIDIDHFKQFNDTYGHVAGNIALVDVANRLNKIARRMDVVCRYGGEEFAVILPKCDIEGAKLFADRFRAGVESLPVETDNDKVSITVSIGCAGYQPDEKLSDFIVRTDEALYRAKEGGRNRVELATQTIDESFVEKSDKGHSFSDMKEPHGK